MTREWADELDRRFKQRLADIAEVAWQDYQAREHKRRQMREPVRPLDKRDDVPLWWAVVALLVILGLLQLWPNDIGL